MTFDEFLSSRLAELLRFAIGLTGSRERAEELAVAALVRAHRRWGSVIASGTPFGAVRTMVVRAYLSAGEVKNPADPVYDQNAVDEDEWGVLQGRLDTLPKRQRAVVLLRYLSGQSAAQIAETLGCGASTVRRDLVRVGTALGIAAEPSDVDLTEADLRGLLDLLADEARFDETATVRTITDRLGSMAPVEAVAVDAVDAVDAEVADEVDEPTAPPAAPLPRSITPAKSIRIAPSRSRFGWIAAAVLAAIVVAVVVIAQSSGQNSSAKKKGIAGAAAVHRGQSSSPTPTPTPPPTPTASTRPAATALPSPVGQPLPGTRILGEYSGSGPRIIRAGRHRVGPGRELVLDAVCRGRGSAAVGPMRLPSCVGTPGGATVTDGQAKSVRVRARAGTRWRFVLLDEPQHGTTGSLGYPADRALGARPPAGRLGAGAAKGSASVHLGRGATGKRVQSVRLLLTCHGSGVSFTSADGRFDGQYTKTCFRGWSYEFDVTRARLPGSLHVKAGPRTSWRLVLLRG